MLHPSTLQLLRFHFSLFLLPVFLFALSQVAHPSWTTATALFFIWHFLVYPSSNGYNSYMDKDSEAIGGLSKPMQPTKQLFVATVVLDITALLLSLFFGFIFFITVAVYILASRAYSYRGIRLKQYPFIGFLTVFVFQGACVYLGTYTALQGQLPPSFSQPLTASLLIGALYPLTQIYQHRADRMDGVTTISYVVGKRGSFILSGILFVAATLCLFFLFSKGGDWGAFFIFLVCTAPVVLFFIWWGAQVWQNEAAANFRNSLLMNVIATLCTTVFFILLFIRNH